MVEQVRITLFTGAGASKPFGYQLTDELTHQLLSGDGFLYHSQLKDRFILGDSANSDRMVKFVCDVCRSMMRGTPNYEQIYSDILYTRRTRRNQTSAFYDQAIELDNLLEAKIKEHFGSLGQYRPWLDVPDTEDPYNESWTLTLNYISNGVRQLLWKQRASARTKFDEYPIYRDLIHHKNVEGLYLFTLNHDMLYEDYFDHHGIPYNDFVEKKSDADEVEVTASNTDEDASIKVTLSKLHGSIDWFEDERLLPGGTADLPGLGENIPFDYRIPYVRKVDNVFDVMRGDATGRSELHNTRFGIMIGAEKGEEYVDYPYLFSLTKFVKHMRSVDRLVIIGYGFRDFAINKILRSWRVQDPENRKTLLITKGDSWIDTTDFLFIPDCTIEEGLEEVDVEELVQFVFGRA